MSKSKLERESERPENWMEDVVLKRDATGAVIQIDVPDDESEEVSGDAGDNQA